MLQIFCFFFAPLCACVWLFSCVVLWSICFYARREFVVFDFWCKTFFFEPSDFWSWFLFVVCHSRQNRIVFHWLWWSTKLMFRLRCLILKIKNAAILTFSRAHIDCISRQTKPSFILWSLHKSSNCYAWSKRKRRNSSISYSRARCGLSSCLLCDDNDHKCSIDRWQKWMTMTTWCVLYAQQNRVSIIRLACISIWPNEISV